MTDMAKERRLRGERLERPKKERERQARIDWGHEHPCKFCEMWASLLCPECEADFLAAGGVTL